MDIIPFQGDPAVQFSHPIHGKHICRFYTVNEVIDIMFTHILYPKIINNVSTVQVCSHTPSTQRMLTSFGGICWPICRPGVGPTLPVAFRCTRIRCTHGHETCIVRSSMPGNMIMVFACTHSIRVWRSGKSS